MIARDFQIMMLKPPVLRQAALTFTRNKSEIENTVMEIAGQIFVKIIL